MYKNDFIFYYVIFVYILYVSIKKMMLVKSMFLKKYINGNKYGYVMLKWYYEVCLFCEINDLK